MVRGVRGVYRILIGGLPRQVVWGMSPRKILKLSECSEVNSEAYSQPGLFRSPIQTQYNLPAGDEIAPLYSPSCTLCNSCTLRDVSLRLAPTCLALNSLCMDI